MALQQQVSLQSVKTLSAEELVRNVQSKLVKGEAPRVFVTNLPSRWLGAGNTAVLARSTQRAWTGTSTRGSSRTSRLSSSRSAAG